MRGGAGTAALTSAAQPVFLDEYTPAGTLVQSLALPTAASGANQPYANSGTATSEGLLTLSGDGRYFVAAGYGAIPGTASVASTASAVTPRVIARVGRDGSIDTSTALNNVFSANNVRGAVTQDGQYFWASGANSGAVLTTLGATTGTSLNTAAPTNLRSIDIYEGQLYCTSGSGSTRGVITVGAGLPTTAGQILALLPGFPTATASPYDFCFADPDTVYVADDRTSGAGGIQKWTYAASTWTLQYTLSPSATTGCRGLTADLTGGTVQLYATTTANALVAVTDTGSAPGVFTTLTTGSANVALRGVRFLRVGAAVSYLGAGSPTSVGVPAIGPLNGLPAIGNTAFAIAAGNLVPNGFGFGLLGLGQLGSGVPVPGAPATVLVHVAPLSTQLVIADGFGDASLPFGLPANPGFVGVLVAAQFLAFDPAMPDPVPIGGSPGMQLVVGW
ncbi:MAG: hypothetical protein FJ265_21135 [Planctomycetes bacterium]|nr:hypothetical protein [Planctomycetota bacterium]